MQRLKSLSFCVGFSTLLALSGCRTSAPEITVCIVDPARNALQCGLADGTTFEVPFQDATHYACISFDDMQVLLNYVKSGFKKP